MYLPKLPASLLGSQTTLTSTDPSLWTTVKLGNNTFINKGLVGFGYVPAMAQDKYGETLGLYIGIVPTSK